MILVFWRFFLIQSSPLLSFTKCSGDKSFTSLNAKPVKMQKTKTSEEDIVVSEEQVKLMKREPSICMNGIKTSRVSPSGRSETKLGTDIIFTRLVLCYAPLKSDLDALRDKAKRIAEKVEVH